MGDTKNRAELCQIAILLVVVSGFYFLLIPTGIIDPEGMSLDQGLPPSFSARLVAALAAGLMLARCGQLVLSGRSEASNMTGGADEVPGIAGDAAVRTEGPPVRGILSMGAGLIFAYALVPMIGFFPAGILLLVVLLKVLGETRPLFLVLPPIVVTTMVWALFEQLLSIRLPDGSLFAG